MPEENKDTNDQSTDQSKEDNSIDLFGKKVEDLLKKDKTTMDDTQKNDYIEKLRDENAKRRIQNKKFQEDLEKKIKALEDTGKSKVEIEKQLEAFTKKEKDKELAEKSEIERLQSSIKDLETKFNTKNSELEETKKELTKKEMSLKVKDRENFVDRLIGQMDFKFSSDYERRGLLSELQEKENNEFKLNDEEIILKIKGFVKEHKKPPVTPSGGPPNRAGEIPLVDEIKALLSIPKGKLSAEQKQRVGELLKMPELGG